MPLPSKTNIRTAWSQYINEEFHVNSLQELTYSNNGLASIGYDLLGWKALGQSTFFHFRIIDAATQADTARRRGWWCYIIPVIPNSAIKSSEQCQHVMNRAQQQTTAEQSWNRYIAANCWNVNKKTTVIRLEDFEYWYNAKAKLLRKRTLTLNRVDYYWSLDAGIELVKKTCNSWQRTKVYDVMTKVYAVRP